MRYLLPEHRAESTLREIFVSLVRPWGAGRTKCRDRDFWALRGIELTVYPGETVGVLGPNGAGKTTLLKMLAGICAPERGQVVTRGRIGCLLSFGVGFHANLSGRENVYLNGSILGMSWEQINERMAAIIAFSELEDFIDAPVRVYSAGMRGRLGFAIAMHLEPDVLLLDEVLGVGDAAFRARAGDILDRFQALGKTVVLATHSAALVRERCTRAVWLEKGRIIMDDAPDTVVDAYLAAAEARAVERTVEPAPREVAPIRTRASANPAEAASPVR